MKKSLLSSLFMFFFVICLLSGNRSIAQDMLTTWQEQLDYVKNNSDKENGGDLSHLILINYTYKGTIKSETDKSGIIASFLSHDSPVILHLPPVITRDTTIVGDSCIIQEKRFPKFEIISIGEMLDIAESINEENPIPQIEEELYKLIEIGFEYLELEWEYKEKKFNSLCIVSNENGGIVHDPIGSNITIRTIESIEFEKRIE